MTGNPFEVDSQEGKGETEVGRASSVKRDGRASWDLFVPRKGTGCFKEAALPGEREQV